MKSLETDTIIIFSIVCLVSSKVLNSNGPNEFYVCIQSMSGDTRVEVCSGIKVHVFYIYLT